MESQNRFPSVNPTASGKADCSLSPTPRYKNSHPRQIPTLTRVTGLMVEK